MEQSVMIATDNAKFYFDEVKKRFTKNYKKKPIAFMYHGLLINDWKLYDMRYNDKIHTTVPHPLRKPSPFLSFTK